MKRKIFFGAIIICIVLSFVGCEKTYGDSNTSNNNLSDQNGYLEDKIEHIVEAGTSVWDGSVASEFGGGNGSYLNPYLIKDGSHLAYLSECCKNGNSFLGEYFRLENNINLNGLEWYPIGQFTPGREHNIKAFEGYFDGNGLFISNFKISVDVIRNESEDIDVGLFGYVHSASIQDLIVKNFYYHINGRWTYVGGLLGRIWGNTTIDNCHVQNGNIIVTASDTWVGGLVGYTVSDVSNCSADATIIVECSIYNDKTIWEDGEEYYQGDLAFRVGGLIGEAEYTKIYNCFSTGDVSGSMITDANKYNAEYVGGLVGIAENTDVYSCYSSAIVRTMDTSEHGDIGGLVGSSSGVVANSYSAGKIECTASGFYCGGLVGSTFGSISNCFSLTDIFAEGKSITCDILLGRAESKKVSVSNCYISSEARIEYPLPYIKVYHSDGESVSPSNFKNLSFLEETVGFEKYKKLNTDNAECYSVWILKEGELPKLFYEDNIKTKDIKIEKDITKYFGIKASKLVKKLGHDYSSWGGALYYTQAQISFVLGDYTGIFTGNETISGLIVKGERELYSGVTASMTFAELKNKLSDSVDEPVFVEMDQTYVTTIKTDSVIYSFVWDQNNYNSEKCSYVYVFPNNN